MANKIDEVKCAKCWKKVEVSKAVFAGKVECYWCWELGINKEKVKELREQLSQYIEIGPNKPKENLTLEQLKEVRQIFSDNYFGDSDERSKEILNALVWMDEDGPPWFISWFLYKSNRMRNKTIRAYFWAATRNIHIHT